MNKKDEKDFLMIISEQSQAISNQDEKIEELKAWAKKSSVCMELLMRLTVAAGAYDFHPPIYISVSGEMFICTEFKDEKGVCSFTYYHPTNGTITLTIDELKKHEGKGIQC